MTKYYKILCERMLFNDAYEWDGDKFVRDTDVVFPLSDLKHELERAQKYATNNWKDFDEVSVYEVEWRNS